MSYHNHNKQSGFTIVELLVGISVIAIVSLMMVNFVNTTLRQYLGLQKDATAFTDLNEQSQRITNVLRGATDITTASSNDITVYAYFFPNNDYVSLIHYYLNAPQTTLYADVTPMTSNPPTGAPVTAKKKTYTVIPYFYQASGTTLFEYLNSAGTSLALPITDLKTIKAIKINLKTPSNGQSNNSTQSISTQISLRNRKNNL